ncbi:MAG TPA: protein kinase [Steroidobacteraceae bacterium]|nr:protein kinase [Steroidobacteraceae bacterium]
MRLLLIVEDPACRDRLRRQLQAEWPQAELVVRPHEAQAALPAEFLAQGYDAVIIDEQWRGGQGLAWLRDLAGRGGFAPALFLADSTDGSAARAARLFGAFAVLPRFDTARGSLLSVVAEASRVQRRAQAYWRVSAEAEAARRFGAVRIPDYRCVRRLAGGSVSQLYLAESGKAGDLMVIKVTPSLRDASGVDQSFERFLLEYEIAHRLRHDSIVRCHELGVADDHAYLAMEYFPDGDLRRRIRAGVTPTDALDLAAQIAGALDALHGAGSLHRDLKPGNVLMRGARRIALSDFGLAKNVGWELDITDPGLIFGTPHYMSPEQGHGEPVDGRSDLYSLGVILYEMLTGEKPYSAANPMTIIYKHRHQPIPRLAGRIATWQPIIDGLLAKLPAQRFGSAAAAAQALRDAAAAARAA